MTAVADTRIRAILTDHVHVNGLTAQITTQLPRDEYVALNKILTALGGRWSTSRRVHEFTVDPGPSLAAYLAGGSAPLPARTRDGFVPTPTDLADKVVTSYSDVQELPPGALVLEPSAGDGQLVRSILDVNPQVQVIAVEPDPHRAAAVAQLDVQLHVDTFEQYATAARPVDAVVMNPPFELPGQQGAWIDHVWRAWELLAPGGRLTAIVPNGFRFRQDQRHRQLRQLVADHGGSVDLPPGAFASSGTGIRAMVIWVYKPVAWLDGDTSRPAWAWRTPTGEPVRVDRPYTAGAAAAVMPVQVYRCPWRRVDRVARCVGRCFGCRRPVWSHDGGDDDPRGPLGDASAGFSPDPFDCDKGGPRVALCVMCGEDGDQYRRALGAADQVWAAVEPEPVGLPVPEPEPVGFTQGSLFDESAMSWSNVTQSAML